MLVQSSESDPLLFKSAVKHSTVSVRELICIAVTASFLALKETYFQFNFLLLLKFIATWYLQSDLGLLLGMPGPCKLSSGKAAVKSWGMCEPSQGPRIDFQTIGLVCRFDKRKQW